jgi:hypothetical protein
MRLVRDDISTRVDDLLRRLAGRGGGCERQDDEL